MILLLPLRFPRVKIWTNPTQRRNTIDSREQNMSAFLRKPALLLSEEADNPSAVKDRRVLPTALSALSDEGDVMTNGKLDMLINETPETPVVSK